MCLLLLVIVITPITLLLSFLGQKAPIAYVETTNFINNSSSHIQDGVLSKIDFINFEDEKVKETIFEFTKKMSDWISAGAKKVIKQTTNFIISLFLILLTTFFFFIDGKKVLEKLKLWSPLPNKYDAEIYKKFREMSYTSMISTFVTAAFQGVIGGIGFLIIGLPAFYPGLLIGFFSLIPYIGSMIIYVPIGIYLILTGDVYRGVYILLWGSVIIGNTDNLIRAWILKGKSKVNPIFIIFSLMGGIVLFGFWGLVLGPLILSLTATIFHIYELEYDGALEK
jgi:predicted PurR-regulated permease PerM